MSEQALIPLLPLRDMVVFPNMAIPLFVGRKKSIAALEQAMEQGKQVLLVAQHAADIDDPVLADLYRVGTVANILQLLRLPDGTVKVLVEGEQRARIHDVQELAGGLAANCTLSANNDGPKGQEVDALMRSAVAIFESYTKLNKKVPSELLPSLTSMESLSHLADTIAAHLNLKLDEKQSILEMEDAYSRLEHIIAKTTAETEVLQIERRIRGRVKQQMEKSQREYYLNEQMKAIQKELGEIEDAPNNLDELEEKIDNAGMSKEALKKAKSEFNKLKSMSPMSAEATVVHNYLDWLVDIPWKKRTRRRLDLKQAEQVLNEDHYGLERVKERIIENLAVQSRVKALKGPIICLVGPPGVGKTSLGRSIARATNREFVRMSLGGVRDEAEIRGHRRTYIGSLPGKIIQNMAKVGVRNPLFLLDEIDKMAQDFRGDPASALLEVLDPEQNSTFGDHYLEVDYDLSEVMFVCTANTLNIPPALCDRMEIIRLPGYTEEEKIEIAQRHLLPKSLEDNGLEDDELQLSYPAMQDIIRYYTREAGVRNLERNISKIARKVVKQLVSEERTDSARVTVSNLDKYLGVKKFRYGLAETDDQVGQVTGLAWTEVGGDLLTIEAAIVSGKGRSQITGSIGDVMQESVKAALTVVRSRAQKLGLDPDFMKNNDLHLHVPEGATPKDGPSAGIGMCTAIVSALTGIPVRAAVAMTGEITLRGDVLPIGGLKEKLLAAHRGGIKKVLIPHENAKDLQEIPGKVKKNVEIILVRRIDQVLESALVRMPESKANDPVVPPKARQPDTDGLRPH